MLFHNIYFCFSKSVWLFKVCWMNPMWYLKLYQDAKPFCTTSLSAHLVHYIGPFRHVSPPSIKPLMSLSLTLGSFFGLEAGQAQVWQACRVQPNNWRSGQETEETPVSSQMPGNEGGAWGPESCS